MCPLCAEEMDLIDYQLKPCKCGYEMAEKDGTEGRCPACCTPCDNEKFVGMASICERLMAEASVDRKKSQTARSKPCS